YRGQAFVIKLGGEVLSSPGALADLAVAVALLDSLSIRIVLVHGGGTQTSDLSRKMGIEPEIVGGRRVTSPKALEVAKMAVAGCISVDVLAALRKEGVSAVGLSGVDGRLLTLGRRPPVVIRDDDGDERTVDFGEVGDVQSVDPTVLEVLLDNGSVPVIASLGCDDEGQVLNVNADTIAEALASALDAEKLVFLTGSPGLLRDPEDPSSLVAFACPDDLKQLLSEGSVRGGMRPKVEACMRAVADGVRRTHIIDGRAPDALLVELFTGDGSGTMIVAKRELDSYREREL
ncbi:MAG: acetylglutamate kinase, partial [bacterium]|nr:acetylglutamate kinase [bacterium]